MSLSKCEVLAFAARHVFHSKLGCLKSGCLSSGSETWISKPTKGGRGGGLKDKAPPRLLFFFFLHHVAG